MKVIKNCHATTLDNSIKIKCFLYHCHYIHIVRAMVKLVLGIIQKYNMCFLESSSPTKIPSFFPMSFLPLLLPSSPFFPSPLCLSLSFLLFFQSHLNTYCSNTCCDLCISHLKIIITKEMSGRGRQC